MTSLGAVAIGAGAASAQEADELLRDASTFLTVAERALGVEGEPMLPLASAS